MIRVLLLLTALAAEPVAKLFGPAAVAVGAPILLDPGGSSGDVEPTIEWASGPAEVAVVPLYDAAGKLAYGLAAATVPGEYQFVVVAEGTPNGARKPVRKYAFLTVAVGDAAPGPLPRPDAGADDPPPATAALARTAWDAKALVTQPVETRERYAQRIAAGYTAAIADPAIRTVEQFHGAVTQAAWEALDRNEQNWQEWLPAFSRVVEALNRRFATLGRPGTLAEVKAAYQQVADGYKRSKS